MAFTAAGRARGTRALRPARHRRRRHRRRHRGRADRDGRRTWKAEARACSTSPACAEGRLSAELRALGRRARAARNSVRAIDTQQADPLLACTTRWGRLARGAAEHAPRPHAAIPGQSARGAGGRSRCANPMPARAWMRCSRSCTSPLGRERADLDASRRWPKIPRRHHRRQHRRLGCALAVPGRCRWACRRCSGAIIELNGVGCAQQLPSRSAGWRPPTRRFGEALRAGARPTNSGRRGRRHRRADRARRRAPDGPLQDSAYAQRYAERVQRVRMREQALAPTPRCRSRRRGREPAQADGAQGRIRSGAALYRWPLCARSRSSSRAS